MLFRNLYIIHKCQNILYMYNMYVVFLQVLREILIW